MMTASAYRVFIARLVELAKCYPNAVWREEVEKLATTMSFLEETENVSITKVRTSEEKLVQRVFEYSYSGYCDMTNEVENILLELDLRESHSAEQNAWKMIFANHSLTTQMYLAEVPAYAHILRKRFEGEYEDRRWNTPKNENRRDIELIKRKLAFVTNGEDEFLKYAPQIISELADFGESLQQFKENVVKGIKEAC